MTWTYLALTVFKYSLPSFCRKFQEALVEFFSHGFNFRDERGETFLMKKSPTGERVVNCPSPVCFATAG
jgi:hypothetical protein